VCSYSLFSSLYFAFSLFFLLFFFNPFLPSISLLCYAYSHLFLFIFNKAHFSDLVLPITDYITDTNSVLDQAIRILQAMVDIAADGGWLFTSLNCMQLMQMVMQVRTSFSPMPSYPSLKGNTNTNSLSPRVTGSPTLPCSPCPM